MGNKLEKRGLRRYSQTMLLVLLLAAAAAPAQTPPDSDLWRQVEVVRTAHGVPHIRAENLRAAGYALAWLQCEDYGAATPNSLLAARGNAALVEGYSRIESDLFVLSRRDKALANYGRLSRDVRDVYEGFAAGINRYIAANRDRFPPQMPADFTGRDVLATEITPPPLRKMRAFVNRLSPAAAAGRQPDGEGEEKDPDEGSNAWAFAPSRTASGKAVLLRNPHLQWSAGYYEAHMTVPGVIDFYGDFRIGGAFAVIGGFNRYLGWSTTNNSPDLDEFYALDADPKTPDHYLFDGRSVPLERQLVTARFRNGDAIASETREFWSTPLGPVVHRGDGKIYVVKFAGDGEYRGGEQFLRMMRARSLAEWKAAMQMRARITSNFTYADRDGNIYFVWNAALPLLPYQPGDDLTARPAKGRADVWTRLVPFDKLPQFLNPKGGYIHNENNSPHFTNVENGVVLKNTFPNFEPPELSLRAQLGLELVRGTDKLSLDDIIRRKHSYRAMLADRVKPDLIAAVKAARPDGDTAAALRLIEAWDNTASPDSRGSMIFQLWWQNYSAAAPPERGTLPDEKRFAVVWNEKEPFTTPRGLADPVRAASSFEWAVGETKRRFGSIDVSWGDVHRVRRGQVDVPVGGCGNDLGCFRTLGFRQGNDGKLAVSGGDGWILAVEFGDVPRAFSVLAYGESSRPDSPWFADQAAMFARGELKPVAFTGRDIDAQSVVRYRPGQDAKAAR